MSITIFKVLTDTIKILADSKYSNKFVLKGGTALATKLIEGNLPQLTRQTKDIDIHCSDKSYWIFFSEHVEDILNDNALGYRYKLLKQRGLEKTGFSDSIVLEVSSPTFTKTIGLDMNLKDTELPTIFIPSLGINAYDNYTMLSDKLSVIFSKKIFRRVKDMYDIYALAQLSNYSMYKLLCVVKNKFPNYHEFELMLKIENYAELEHAFTKFSGLQMDFDFKSLYTVCCKFSIPVLTCLNADNYGGEFKWSKTLQQWGSYPLR